MLSPSPAALTLYKREFVNAAVILTPYVDAQIIDFIREKLNMIVVNFFFAPKL